MMRKRFVALLLVVACTVAVGCAKKMESKPADRAYAPAPSYQPSTSAPYTESKPAASPTPTAPPADTTFQNYGDNPRMPTAVQSTSTFAIDVDTASYTVARSYLEKGMLPPPDAIRAEEFINYFPQNYAGPAGAAVGVTIEGSISPFRSQTHLVQIGLRARTVDKYERKPAVLTFVIDTSGSMEQDGRLELVKESLLTLVDQLQADDRVALITYSNTAELRVAHTYDKAALKSAISRLRPDASTNAEAGLRLGYQEAARNFRQGAINRVILASDGVANVGNTSPDGILRTVSDYKARGITLTAVGVGMGNYNDVLLEQLADKGDGTYHYVDTAAEARKIFVNQLSSTLETVAKDVKVQVQFYPEQVESYRLVGYENRVMANEQFRNNAADGGDMGAGHAVTALYEVRLKGNGPALGNVSIRYRDVATGEMIEMPVPIYRKDVQMTLASSYARIRWSAAVAEFAGILGGNPWASESRLADVIAVARRAADDLDNPRTHMEAIGLMEKAMNLRR
ncbi:MAG TPA: von Willebrand factor type A domain-containing protein [Symbiobacteriaceae bacterium]|nr:von Willebrand factor type A domain-containing protein [Symbiobacteriaceae bacterium]